MKRRQFLVQSGLTLGSVAACGGRQTNQVSQGRALMVAAAASLQDALGEVALLEQPGDRPPLRYTFGGSGTLQRQIEQGAPVDLFLAAAPFPLDALERQGLLWAGSRRNLLGNSLVLIVPQNSPELTGFQDLGRDRPPSLALGNPATVPAGYYGEAVLRYFGFYDRLQPHLIWAQDVRQVLAYVATGNVEGGLVYGTDAQVNGAVRRVAVAPPESHAPIVYPGAVLQASGQRQQALAFLDFLGQPPAQSVFRRYGFGIVPGV